MLITLRDVLNKAKKEKYAVGDFIVINLEMAKGVIQAAEELNSPVIISPTEVFLDRASLEELSPFLLEMAKNAKVPVVLHYDHGFTEEKIMQTLKYGYSSVMYDCSMLNFEENIDKVTTMAKVAHLFGASIEAELGHVGSADKTSNDNNIYTEVDKAKEYCKATNVDALAVAIGTAHGQYKDKPKLDFERLQTLAKEINCSIVLHGGSGLSNEDFYKCIECGVTKINIFTDLNYVAAKAAYDFYNQKNFYYTDLMPHIIECIKETTMEKICIFGSKNKV